MRRNRRFAAGRSLRARGGSRTGPSWLGREESKKIAAISLAIGGRKSVADFVHWRGMSAPSPTAPQRRWPPGVCLGDGVDAVLTKKDGLP